MVLVTICSCPQIISDPRLGEDLVSDELPIEEIVDGVCARSVKINIVTVQTIELIGQVLVHSILYERSDITPFPDEVDDLRQSKGFGGLGASTSEGVGQPGENAEAGRGENYNTEGLAGGCASGERLDVSTMIQSLKEVLLRSSTWESRGLDRPDPHWAATPSAGTISGMQPTTGHGDHQGDSTPLTVLTKTCVGTSSGAQVIANPVRPLSPLPSGDSLAPEKTAPPSGSGPIAPPSDLVPGGDVAALRMSSGNERDTAYIDGVLAEFEAAEVGNTAGGIGAEKSSNMQTPISVSDLPLDPTMDQLPTHTPATSERSADDVSGPLMVTDTIDGDPGTETVSEQLYPIAHPTAVEKATGEVRKEETVSVAVQTRASKRSRTPAIKYTPPAPPLKKQKGKKGASREKKVSTAVPSIPAAPSHAATTLTEQPGSVLIESELPPIREKPSSAALTPTKKSGSFVSETKIGAFVGGFSPCVRRNAFRLAGFCTVMHTPREYNLGEGVIVDNNVFRSFFDSTQTQPPKAADMVVTFIRRRLCVEGITAYDFLPSSFVESLRGEYQQFCRVKEIANFSFSNIFVNPGFPNMRWDDKVEVLYFPFQADGLHWIGVVVDIANWCIEVLDCNSACLSEEKLELLLNPIVVLLPLLIRRNGGKASTEAALDPPMPITRLDLPLLCEQREFSCIASILLMELHASQNLPQAAHINTDSLAIAAQTYAVEAFATFNPEHLQEFPRA
ncbi:hypothetical protein Bca4012_062900 [Brassica carinata]